MMRTPACLGSTPEPRGQFLASASCINHFSICMRALVILNHLFTPSPFSLAIIFGSFMFRITDPCHSCPRAPG
jgi:hypothetical protein